MNRDVQAAEFHITQLETIYKLQIPTARSVTQLIVDQNIMRADLETGVGGGGVVQGVRIPTPPWKNQIYEINTVNLILKNFVFFNTVLLNQ